MTSDQLVRAYRGISARTIGAGLSLVSGAARGGPVRRGAGEARPDQRRRVVLVHSGVTAVVIGVASALSVVFFAIPPAWFAGVFSAVTIALMLAAAVNLRAARVLAARGLGFWAGIGWGLTVSSWAYLLGLTGFVPHLLLAWTLGTVALAIVTANAVQLALAGVLASAWIAAAALFGESLLPGAVIVAVLLAFPLYARPSRLVGGALTLVAATLATATMVAHGSAGLVGGLVAAAATIGVLRAVAARLPYDPLTGTVPSGCPGRGIAAVSNLVGVGAVAVSALPPVLDALRADFASAGRPAVVWVPVGLLVAATAAPGIRRRDWLRPSIAWTVGVAALMLALYLPDPLWVTGGLGLAAATLAAAGL
ncbi:MAG TPA: hypothetical protein VE172_20815, partial [Stackebrandtia sp.]